MILLLSLFMIFQTYLEYNYNNKKHNPENSRSLNEAKFDNIKINIESKN